MRWRIISVHWLRRNCFLHYGIWSHMCTGFQNMGNLFLHCIALYSIAIFATIAIIRDCVIWFFGFILSTFSSIRACTFLPRCMECQHGLATRKVSVRPSVRPSVKRVICNRMKEMCANILTPHERAFTLFYYKKNGWWGWPPSTWNFGSNWPRWIENADFQPIFARSASSVTPSKKA